MGLFLLNFITMHLIIYSNNMADFPALFCRLFKSREQFADTSSYIDLNNQGYTGGCVALHYNFMDI